MDETCAPIETLSELYSYMRNPPKWGRLTTSISKRSKVVRNADLISNGFSCHVDLGDVVLPPRHEFGTLPKTLVCHDMMNGYKDDKYIDGSENSAAYTFYHWAAIDIFVYFSHHFITIPPLGWINVAHKHGVQILGTIITEWNAGANTCREFLKSDEEMLKFVNHLVELSKYFKLDGWLLNIENEVTDPERLIKFVKTLTDNLHREINNSLVIWYDSVTNEGKLDWQNCLNNKNKVYFDSCDGIFTNYTWNRRELVRSLNLSGSRKHDVYVGVDVWGRNFIGGGRFNTAEAVRLIFEHGLSMAIFAPGWTHEGIVWTELYQHQYDLLQIPDANPCMDELRAEELVKSNAPIYECAMKSHFILRENTLWCTLWPYLNVRGPTKLPFHTYFCIGSGMERRYAGRVISNIRWSNLRDQQYQPTNISCGLSFEFQLEEPTIKPSTTTTINAEITDDEPNVDDDELNVDDDDELNVDDDEPNVDDDELNVDDDELNDVENRIDSIVITETEAVKDYVPIRRYKLELTQTSGCVVQHTADSYYGGNCLKISPTGVNQQPTVRLFQCEFHCDHNFIMYSITKPQSADQDLHVILTMMNNTTKRAFRVVLIGDQLTSVDYKGSVLQPLNTTDTTTFDTVKRNLFRLYPSFGIDTKNDKGWIIRYYEVRFPNSSIHSIDCRLLNDSSPVLLGGIGVVRDILNF